MTRQEAIERARELHKVDRKAGEQPTGATRRWVEIMDDPSKPGPIRDTLCWVVEFSGDDGGTADVYIEDATRKLLKKEAYA